MNLKPMMWRCWANLAYVAGPLGTWIVDVSDPAAATLVGSIPQGSTSITIDDHWAYLTPFNLEIYDLAEPLAPVRMSYLPCPAGCFSPGQAGGGGRRVMHSPRRTMRAF